MKQKNKKVSTSLENFSFGNTKGVDFVLYRLVWLVFFLPEPKLVQKHICFVLVQILVISGYFGLTGANIIFWLKNLYWSGTEKERLSDLFYTSSLLLRPHTAIPNASFFCSILFVFSNSFYLSFLILCAESAHTRLIKKFYFIFTFIVLCVLVSDPCEHRNKLNSLFLFLHFHYFPLSSTMNYTH